MATTYERPAGAYTSTSTTTNATKYQTDSGSSTAISSAKVDGDFNKLIDAINQLGIDIDAVIAAGLPTQTGNADKMLVTDGTTASWSLVGANNLDTDSVTTDKILNDNVTLDKLASGTAGALFGYDASGNPAETAVGTAGQVLTSNGAGAVPTMQSLPASGSLVFISETVISGTPASADITSGIDSTYDTYFVDIVDLIPATDVTTLGFRITTDGGSTFKSGATDYRFHSWQMSGSAATYAANAVNGHTEIWLATALGNLAADGVNAHLVFHNPSSSTNKFAMSFQGTQLRSTSGTFRTIGGGGVYDATTAVNGFQLFMSSGNLTSGTIRLYGLKKS